MWLQFPKTSCPCSFHSQVSFVQGMAPPHIWPTENFNSTSCIYIYMYIYIWVVFLNQRQKQKRLLPSSKQTWQRKKMTLEDIAYLSIAISIYIPLLKIGISPHHLILLAVLARVESIPPWCLAGSTICFSKHFGSCHRPCFYDQGIHRRE